MDFFLVSSLYIISVNNLYGWAMVQLLTISGFRWLSEREIVMLEISNVTDDSEDGYILEVDLEYPPELHDQHSDYPLAPGKYISK